MRPLTDLFDALELDTISQEHITSIRLAQQSETDWAVGIVGQTGEEYAGGIIKAPVEMKEHLRSVAFRGDDWETSITRQKGEEANDPDTFLFV